MIELIGAILYLVVRGAFYIFKYAFIGMFYFFKYTLPLWFIGLGIALSVAIGGDMVEYAQMGGKWAEKTRTSLEHEVTVAWTDTTETIYVREDRLATVRGDAERVGGYYYGDMNTIYAIENVFFSNESQNAHSYLVVTPVVLNPRSGYRLLGFFNTPYGGVMYFNAGGYAVRTIDENMTVYAVYEPIEDTAP